MTFVPYLNINVNLIEGAVASSPTKNVLMAAQRITEGDFIASPIGNQPNYYVPFEIPSFATGIAALQYLADTYGLIYKIGIDFSLTLPAPTSVTNVNGLTVLTWSTIPDNFATLTDIALSGSLSQTLPSAVSGTVRSATILLGVATMYINGTVAFVDAGNSGGVLTLTGENNVINPDPNATDPICLGVWYFYQTALSLQTSPDGAPKLFLSILSDRDSTISPSDTPIVLGDPTSVSLSGNIATLTYPSSTAGLGYLPTTLLGNTLVNQAVSNAAGKYMGYTVSGSNLLIEVEVTSGTFTNTDSVSITLDNSINFYNYLDGIDLFGSVLQFPVTDQTSIDTDQAAFFDGNELINQGNQVLNKHYFTYAMAGNITSLPSNAGNLPNINSQYDIFTTYPYYPKFGDIPLNNTDGTTGSLAVSAAIMYALANQDAPYYSLANVKLNHLPVSRDWKNYNYSNAQGGTGDIAISQGWYVLYVATDGIVTILQSNTALTTIPNTNITDNEFRYTHIWDVIRWIKREAAIAWEEVTYLPNNQGMQLMSPAYLIQLRGAMLSVLKDAQNLGMIENLQLYQNKVVVAPDLTNVNQVNVTIPAQIIPQINGADITINVLSATITSF